MALDLDLIRRAAVGSHGRKTVIRALTTWQIRQNARLSEAVASGSATSGEDLNTEDGSPVFIFYGTPCTAPYIVK